MRFLDGSWNQREIVPAAICHAFESENYAVRRSLINNNSRARWPCFHIAPNRGSRQSRVYTEKDFPMMRDCFERDLVPLIADKLAKHRAASSGRSVAAQPKIDKHFEKQRRNR